MRSLIKSMATTKSTNRLAEDYRVASPQRAMQFRVRGMDCAEEVAVLKSAVGPVVGGADRLAFDILNARMVASVEPGDVNADAIIKAVAGTGMRAELWQDDGAAPEERGFWPQYSRTLLTSASGAFLALGFIAHAILVGGFWRAFGGDAVGAAHEVPLVARLLYGLSVLSGVWFFLPKAWYSLVRIRPDMNLLMTIAVVGAIAIGEWSEAATVAFLFAVSLALESWSVGRARRAVAALLDLTPPTARLKHADGREEEVPAEQVSVGATFIVRPGERIPLDGRVASGLSHVNQAPITGESMPVEKQVASDVFAGTINGDGVLEVECTKAAQDSTLAHIIRMVGEAQSRRAPSEQWVEKFARIYTPAIMALVSGAPLLPCFIERVGTARFRPFIGEPIFVATDVPREQAIRAAAQQFADQLTERLRAHPEYWYTFYRYWDSQSENPQSS